MSLENEMAALTAALKENTAALQAGGTAPTKSAAKTTAKAAPKKEAAPKGMTAKNAAEFKGHFVDYLKTDSKAETDERKKHALAIAEYFGVQGVTKLDKAQWPEALGYLQTYMDGGVPEFDDAGDGDDEDDGL